MIFLPMSIDKPGVTATQKLLAPIDAEGPKSFFC